jgi:hypothetical protein
VENTPVCVIAADVNGDGPVDLITANETGHSLTVLTNNGSGVFGSNATLNAFGGPQSVVAADINGDGNVDLICTSGSGITVLTNNGSGVFGSNATLNAFGGAQSVMAADINGDGKMDLICNSESAITVFTNNGSGVFGSNAMLNVTGGLVSLVAADINGDGNVDLIGLIIYPSAIIVLTNNGSGAFGSNATINYPGGGDCLTMADVNGDGKPDIIFAAGSIPSKIYVWTNNGDGVFGSNATYTVGEGILSITAADVNGDGNVDLICANGESEPGTLSVLTNDGSGEFGSNVTLNVGSEPCSVVAADVNGDGKMDLISANYSANSVSVLINTSIFSPPTSTPTLNINASGNNVLVSWPSASAGWSLQQNPDLTTTNWSPSGYSGYSISDDGTNKSLNMPPITENLFFRLLHP